MRKYLLYLFIVLMWSSGCVELTKEYYYINSPDNSECLTILNVTWLIEPNETKSKLGSGIYLFYGQVERGDHFPDEYLKLKYSDYSPIGIVWDDTIKIAYNYIERNTFDSGKKVIVYDEIANAEYESAAALYRKRTNNAKTAYDLDEIFRNHGERSNRR